jgi:hypothetical protein
MPRCTDSHAAQSWRLVRSQKSTAYAGSKPGRAAASGGKYQVQTTWLSSGPSGSTRWVMR